MNYPTIHRILAIGCLALSGSVVADEVRTERVQFARGSDHAKLSGRITGRDSIVYKLGARDGQFLKVLFRSANNSANFNIYVPGKGPGDEALYVSDTGGRSYYGQLYKDGDHSISVFLNRNAARQGQSADFEIEVRITNKPQDADAPAGAEGGVDREAGYGKIKFRVTAPPAGDRFTIAPSGLTVSNEPITVEAPGRVVDLLVDDIDGDNWPEAAVIVEEPEEKRRSAHVFSTYGGKSYGMANLPPVRQADLLTGYAGGDEYAFVENTFIRRFPIYEKGEKSGKTRQLQYKLKPGEAMKQLVLDRHLDY